MKMARIVKALPHLMICLAASGVASAQNSDFGLLLGVIVPHYQVSSGPTNVVMSDAGGALQLNYAYQLKGWQAGDLYLEFPFFLAWRGNVLVASPGYSATSTGGIGALTPGLRFKLRLVGRMSAYAAAGAGIGWFASNNVTAASHTATVEGGTTATAGFDFGGGLDFRLTRLLSFKGEARDLITSQSSLPGGGGHNNGIYSFGLAFHF